MNTLVNMAEGGPISDVAVTKTSDEDLIMLSIGFRLAAEIGELRFWVCRMCNGNLVVEKMWIFKAQTHTDAKDKMTHYDPGNEINEDYKFLEVQHELWLVLL
jgi:hypothetical protein